jgi:hypothetical protein
MRTPARGAAGLDGDVVEELSAVVAALGRRAGAWLRHAAPGL